MLQIHQSNGSEAAVRDSVRPPVLGLHLVVEDLANQVSGMRSAVDAAKEFVQQLQG